jgi:hypothetical protein
MRQIAHFSRSAFRLHEEPFRSAIVLGALAAASRYRFALHANAALFLHITAFRGTLTIASSSSLFRHSISKQRKELQVARRPQAFSWCHSQVRLTLHSRIAHQACTHCIRRMHELRSLALPEPHIPLQAIAQTSCSVSTSQWRNLAQRCRLKSSRCCTQVPLSISRTTACTTARSHAPIRGTHAVPVRPARTYLQRRPTVVRSRCCSLTFFRSIRYAVFQHSHVPVHHLAAEPPQRYSLTSCRSSSVLLPFL